jgi:hypothetical protein
MTAPVPTLRSTLSKLQKAVAKFYVRIEERFAGNNLVRDMWSSMVRDLEAQVASLKKLPPSFWQALQSEEKVLARAALRLYPARDDEIAGSLQSCLVRTINLEEPVILAIYAPLIRHLRGEWIEHALDFYIMVKAHIARVSQSIQLFSGDPELSQRCVGLLKNFEKEVQEQPAAAPVRSLKKSKKTGHAAKSSRQAKASAGKPRLRALNRIATRGKPIVQKIEISRRRVSR